jgi:hypothetical protein
MKSFVKNFFEVNRSRIKESGNKLSIELSEELRKAFKQDELHLVFDARDVDEESELVTHGSYALNTIYHFLQDRGGKIVSKLEEKYKPVRLEEQIKIYNGSIKSIKQKKEKVVDILFNFKVSYLSDEKLEDIFTLGVDTHGTVFDAGLYYNDRVMQDVQPLPQKGSIDVTRKDLEVQFRECLKAASERAQSYGKSLQNDILKRLHRNISRVKGYYTAQIQELHRNQPSYEEKRLHLERELDHKLKEEINNHKLRIVLKLLSYHIIERPEVKLNVKLSSDSATGDVMMEMVFDPYSGEIDLGICPVCRSVVERIVISHDGRIGCTHCTFVCATCKKTSSDLPHAAACVVCSEPLCVNCQTECVSCGQPVCDKHHHVCSVGNEIVCTTCLKSCGVCNKGLCSDHTFLCHASHETLCFEHRVICKGCRRIYSPNYVQRLKKGEKICTECGSAF